MIRKEMRHLPLHQPQALSAPRFSTIAFQSISLRLILDGDLERKRLALLEHVPAVEAQAWDATDRELDRQ